MCTNSELIQNIQNRMWMGMFERLQSVSKEDKPLYNWCKAQRKAINTPYSDPVKVLLLNSLGFDWEGRAFISNS